MDAGSGRRDRRLAESLTSAGKKSSSDACEIFCINPEKVNRLRSQVTLATGLGNLFKR